MEDQQQKVRSGVPSSGATGESTHHVTLNQLINLAIEKEASDIHFGEGRRIALRVRGKFMFIENLESLSSEQAEGMVSAMIDGGDDRKLLERRREIDFSYTHKAGINFRVNAFYQRGRLSVVMRMSPKRVPTMDELGTPAQIRKLLLLKEGLILVTGPAGGGKTTTVQAMLEYISEVSVGHILTIENPIEYLFRDRKSFFSQREVGKDTMDFHTALRSAEHEDANVIMVSEINDYETLDAVLTAVETGHLVIANLTTKNARQTVERLFSMYPVEEKEQVHDRLADNLIAILSQDLAPKVDGTGNIAVYEVLLNTPAVRRVIRAGNTSQIENAIHAGGGEQMVTLADYAYRLSEEGIISEEAYQEFSSKE